MLSICNWHVYDSGIYRVSAGYLNILLPSFFIRLVNRNANGIRWYATHFASFICVAAVNCDLWSKKGKYPKPILLAARMQIAGGQGWQGGRSVVRTNVN